jgi:hypothetical protein
MTGFKFYFAETTGTKYRCVPPERKTAVIVLQIEVHVPARVQRLGWNLWSEVPDIALPEPGHDTVSSGNHSVCKNRKHGVNPLARRSQPDQPGRLCNRAGLNTVPLPQETFITSPINNCTSHVD